MQQTGSHTGTGDDASAVSQVVLRERQGRDRGWWEQMAALYWPDSTVRLSAFHGDGPGFVEHSKRLFARGARPVHQMFAPAVTVRGDKAHAEAGTLAWSTTEVDGTPANCQTMMRLNYRLERRGGEWRIVCLDVVYQFASIAPVAPGVPLTIPPAELARYRPSYAVLAWHMARRGIVVSDDELGDDRPEALEAFYAETLAWLEK
ncbi:nuclear transport factor 2 family protein [Streptomyces sp. NPDC056296]|uniref:nuclear transport factor 2 family protein n=1 Tax=Streptomyces sp. NPDC056296 TaxID=3345775 RepID=UPI0035D67B1E